MPHLLSLSCSGHHCQPVQKMTARVDLSAQEGRVTGKTARRHGFDHCVCSQETLQWPSCECDLKTKDASHSMGPKPSCEIARALTARSSESRELEKVFRAFRVCKAGSGSDGVSRTTSRTTSPPKVQALRLASPVKSTALCRLLFHFVLTTTGPALVKTRITQF